MMTTNKILTVSYGTFSCTLEGFDDSFETMKAIAEYFRDLAAEDRYFGAEPPQPDADVMARIAQREISRQVEAREHEGRIVLSAAQAAPSGSDATTAQSEVSGQEMSQAEIMSAAEAAVPAESITSKLQRIRAVVSKQETIEEEEFEDDEPAEDLIGSVARDLEAAIEIDDAAMKQAEHAAPEVEEPAEEETAEAMAEDDASELDEVLAETPEITEAQTDDGTEAPEAEGDDTASLLSDLITADDGHLDETYEDEGELAASEEMPASDALEAAAHDSADDAEPFQLDQSLATAAEDADDMVAEEVDNAETADLEQPATAVTEIEEIDADADLTAFLDGLKGGPDASEDDNLFEGAEEDKAETIEEDPKPATQRRRSRIIRVKRAPVEPVAEAEDADEDTMAAQAEAELRDELAAVEAELAVADEVEPEAEQHADTAAGDAEAETEAEAEAVEEVTAEATDEPETTSEEEPLQMAQYSVDTEEDEDKTEESDSQATKLSQRVRSREVPFEDVERLMNEAESQMGEPEGSNRRSAFAHLKAAVAARRADRNIVRDGDGQDDEDYRSDLASVVRPRRPNVSKGGTERPADGGGAPLKLVAEQRIDQSDDETSEDSSVVPRRVDREETAGDDAGRSGFADFAAEVGAHDLPELLEAAAAYLSFVEGREQFSRPQLMTKVRQVESGEFSREAGLRSFGQLLRSGKIEKIKGGRFAVTGEIGFKPDEREAG